MVASHNEATMKFTVQTMDEFGIHPETGGVFFGQLLGMCDHVSFAYVFQNQLFVYIG